MNKDAIWLLLFVSMAIGALILAEASQQPPLKGYEYGATLQVNNMEEAKDVAEELGLQVDGENGSELYCSGPVTKGMWMILKGHKSIFSIQPKQSSIK